MSLNLLSFGIVILLTCINVYSNNDGAELPDGGGQRGAQAIGNPIDRKM